MCGDLQHVVFIPPKSDPEDLHRELSTGSEEIFRTDWLLRNGCSGRALISTLEQISFLLMSSAPASSQLLWLLNALNALFEQNRIAYRVDLPDPTLAQQTPFAAQIHPNALIQLYSALFGSAVSLPTPVQDTFNSRVKSVKMLIGTLAQDVLKMDLSYIDPLAFLEGKEDAVVELVQVVIAVAQIVEKRKKASQAPRRRTNSSSSSNSNLQLSSAAGRLQPHLTLSEPSEFDSDDSVEPVSEYSDFDQDSDQDLAESFLAVFPASQQYADRDLDLDHYHDRHSRSRSRQQQLGRRRRRPSRTASNEATTTITSPLHKRSTSALSAELLSHRMRDYSPLRPRTSSLNRGRRLGAAFSSRIVSTAAGRRYHKVYKVPDLRHRHSAGLLRYRQASAASRFYTYRRPSSDGGRRRSIKPNSLSRTHHSSHSLHSPTSPHNHKHHHHHFHSYQQYPGEEWITDDEADDSTDDYSQQRYYPTIPPHRLHPITTPSYPGLSTLSAPLTPTGDYKRQLSTLHSSAVRLPPPLFAGEPSPRHRLAYDHDLMSPGRGRYWLSARNQSHSSPSLGGHGQFLLSPELKREIATTEAARSHLDKWAKILHLDSSSVGYDLDDDDDDDVDEEDDGEDEDGAESENFLDRQFEESKYRMEKLVKGRSMRASREQDLRDRFVGLSFE